MEVVLKYYKYVDPKSGEVKKDVGLLTSRLATKSKKKVDSDGSVTVISEEHLHIVSEKKPIVSAELLEISKEDFDSLPATALVDAKRAENFKKLKDYRNNRVKEVKAPKVKEQILSVESEVTVVDVNTYKEIKTKFENGESTVVDKLKKKDK